MSRVLFVVLLALALVFSVFTTSPPDLNGAANADAAAGFAMGLWHGLTGLVNLVVSVFRDGIGVYEVANTGFTYNLGFILGGGGFFYLLFRVVRQLPRLGFKTPE